MTSSCQRSWKSWIKYPALEQPLLERFVVTNKQGLEATKELIDAVIRWEKNTPHIYESLETTLENKFLVKPRVAPIVGKVARELTNNKKLTDKIKLVS